MAKNLTIKLNDEDGNLLDKYGETWGYKTATKIIERLIKDHARVVEESIDLQDQLSNLEQEFQREHEAFNNMRNSCQEFLEITGQKKLL